ncbi:MAG: esterase-like activity of phytase family protein [Vicinamibacteria bacterium]
MSTPALAPLGWGALLAGALLSLAAGEAPGDAESLEVRATPVALVESDPSSERVGQLDYLGGLALRSPDARFGGFSGALVSPDGTVLDAVSDEGRFVRLRLVQDERGRLVNASALDWGALRGLDGDPLPRKNARDAEELARMPDGALVVAFEHHHRLWVYRGPQPALAARPSELGAPAGLEKAPANGGIEALAVLPDGRLLALAEELPDPQGGVAAFLRAVDGSWSRLSYQPAGDPRPSAAAALPSGDVLVLERAYSPISGLHIRLLRVAAGEIAPGARLTGELVAEMKPPLTLDNLESVAVRASDRPGEEALVYLLSDDNFNPLQRTLLLLFALRRTEPLAAAAR